MIYWHVERKSLGIHSQLKSPSSSEVASMIQGVLRHCTELAMNRQYVDSHGQSTVAFAFTKLLGFQLLPRLKRICKQRLYRPDTGKPGAYPNLALILTRPIDWELIRQQYDEMVKYATALRLGTAEAEAILCRFTRENTQHPTYKALMELGKAVKTVFLARYLHDRALRAEINDGLNVVEQWNSANDFIFFARRGEVSSNRREDQEVSMLSLHLLQNCMVYVNTLTVQNVLARPEWKSRLTARPSCPAICAVASAGTAGSPRRSDASQACAASIAHLPVRRPHRAAHDRGLAEVERGSSAAGPAAQHHQANLRPAQQGERRQAPLSRRRKLISGGAGQHGHPAAAVRQIGRGHGQWRPHVV